MGFDASKLRGLEAGRKLEWLRKAIDDGSLAVPAAVRIAHEHGLSGDAVEHLTSTRFSGRGYAEPAHPGSVGGSSLSRSNAIFKGLLGWASFGAQPKARPTQRVGLGEGASGVEVPADVAARIKERIAFVSSRDPAQPALAEELRRCNCFGAAATALLGPGVLPQQMLLFPSEETLVPHKVYPSYEALASALREVPVPAALLLGAHESHVALFLGFDAEGRGVVFHKGNVGENFPWEIVSLETIYERYCAPDYYGHEHGVRVVQPAPGRV